MIHHIFTIRDQKADAFLPPFFLPRTAMAERVFSDCINDASHQFYKHPEDFTLFTLGTFDDDDASMVLIEGPRSLGNGLTFKKDSENNG